MKAPLIVSLLSIALFTAVGPTRVAFAGPDDGGTDRDAAIESGSKPVADGGPRGGSSTDASDGTSDEGPFACNKALCATTTGATACNVAPGFEDGRVTSPVSVAAAMAAIGLGTLRRRAQRTKERTR